MLHLKGRIWFHDKLITLPRYDTSSITLLADNGEHDRAMLVI